MDVTPGHTDYKVDVCVKEKTVCDGLIMTKISTMGS